MVMNQTTSTRQRLTWIESDQSWRDFVGAIVLTPIRTPLPPLLVLIFHLVLMLGLINPGLTMGILWDLYLGRWTESGLTAFSSVPRDYCDKYGVCGANANCTINDNPICQCLIGFKPKSQEKWNLKDWFTVVYGIVLQAASIKIKMGL
ncbi:hypothetical protein TIFTF001_037910 [Ficus carica]|uniref:S-locus glycoprotein domain-containing protein n=1 Tax=Ficus carica TaxID=3494 RepID=A0AA88E6H3_FICCA|nr:hypothetical protein TIFTF001_037910 [Ficus carica]